MQPYTLQFLQDGPLFAFIYLLEFVGAPEVYKFFHLLKFFQHNVSKHDLKKVLIPVNAIVGPNTGLITRLIFFFRLIQSVELVGVGDLVTVPLFKMALVRV